MEKNKGKLIIYSGPSGSGKGTIKDIFLKNKDLNIGFSVSATTRKKRDNEVHGEDYFFITKKEFQKLIKTKAFIEWAKYSKNYYGTLKSNVEEQLNKGKNVLLEIELKGVKQILKSTKDAITIFLKPPSIEELKTRLEKRNTETKKEIEKRLKTSKKELKQSHLFTYVITNEDPNKAAKEITSILRKEI